MASTQCYKPYEQVCNTTQNHSYGYSDKLMHPHNTNNQHGHGYPKAAQTGCHNTNQHGIAGYHVNKDQHAYGAHPVQTGYGNAGHHVNKDQHGNVYSSTVKPGHQVYKEQHAYGAQTGYAHSKDQHAHGSQVKQNGCTQVTRPCNGTKIEKKKVLSKTKKEGLCKPKKENKMMKRNKKAGNCSDDSSDSSDSSDSDNEC